MGLSVALPILAQKSDGSQAKCPVNHGAMTESSTTVETNPQSSVGGTTNSDWWPNQLNLDVLRQNSSLTNPMGPQFDYRAAFTSLDYFALKNEIKALLTTSQEWWPADYGN